MSEIGTLLHASDLHFSSELTESGRSLWGKLFNQGLNTHGFGKIDAFSAKYTELVLTGDAPDVVIATGDISTDGSPESLTTALEFIEQGYIRKGSSNRIVTKGLGAGPDKRIILPGNHDRYTQGTGPIPLQQPNRRFEEIMGIAHDFPYVVGFRKESFRDDISHPAILFFVFDSTITEQAPFAKAYNPFYSIARGYIGDAECRWLTEQAQLIRREKAVTGLNGEELPVDYDASVRIALLHHHPISDIGGESDGRWTLMENSLPFVNACAESGIDIVLFGHQHRAKYHLMRKASGGHGIHFFCSPSTSEFSEANNGFYLFEINTQGFAVVRYDLVNNSFIENALPPFSYYREVERSSKRAT